MDPNIQLADLYTEQTTFIHRLEARVKLPIVLGYILTLLLIPRGAWGAFALMGALWLTGALIARLPPRKALTRSLIAIPFLMSGLTLLLRPSTPLIAQWHVGPWTFSLGEPSVNHFLTVALRSWLGLLATVLLLHTTPVPEILSALETFHVPSPLITILHMAYRYLFILVDEAKRLTRARTARSASPVPPHRPRGLRWRVRVTGMLIGTLLVRSLQRSENVYYAMVSRGYRGGAWSLSHPTWTSKERRLVLLSMFIYALIFWISRR